MSTPIATQISIVPGLEWVHFALRKQQREKANQVKNLWAMRCEDTIPMVIQFSNGTQNFLTALTRRANQKFQMKKAVRS